MNIFFDNPVILVVVAHSLPSFSLSSSLSFIAHRFYTYICAKSLILYTRICSCATLLSSDRSFSIDQQRVSSTSIGEKKDRERRLAVACSEYLTSQNHLVTKHDDSTMYNAAKLRNIKQNFRKVRQLLI